MPHHLCTLPPPAWWSWSEGEGAGGARSCADAARHTSASPPVVSPAFAKAFERKILFILPLLPFLLALRPPTVQRAPVQCPCCPEETKWVWGCGSGNCSHQTGLGQKAIIIIKPLMVSREIRRYSCSLTLTCSSWCFLSLYGEFWGLCAAANFVACLKYLGGAARNN